MKKNKGIHYIYDFTNIKCSNPKKYFNEINEILDNVIKECNLNQVGRSDNFFDGENTPPGFANVRVLDESHISAHSYSDIGILAVDIFTCGNLENGDKAGKLLKKLIIDKFNAIIKKEYIIERFLYD